MILKYWLKDTTFHEAIDEPAHPMKLDLLFSEPGNSKIQQHPLGCGRHRCTWQDCPLRVQELVSREDEFCTILLHELNIAVGSLIASE